MRIAQESAETLAFFTQRSWIVMVVGVLMGLMATVLVMVPAKAMTLTCTRQGGYPACELLEDRVYGTYRIARMPVPWIRGAEVQPIAIGSGHFYRLNLDIDDGFKGPYYFAWYGDKKKAEADAAAFNAFLADPAARGVRIQNDKRVPFSVMGGLLAFLALVFVFWGSYRIQATFSRPDGRVRVMRTGLLGSHHRDFTMSDIRSLDVAGLGGDCQLFLTLHSGDRIDLSSSIDTEGLVGPRKVRESRLKDADRLRAFCDLG